MVADNATLPVNPLLGVTVMVEVFPVIAPAATLMEDPAKEKVGRLIV
jgi:hypothetical protein